MTEIASLAVGLAATAFVLALLVPPETSHVDLSALGPWRWWRRRSRSRAVGARSLDVLRATQAALRAGIPLPSALRLAISGMPPLADDPFVQALRAFELSASIHASLRELARRANDRRTALALDALAVAGAEQLPATRCAAIIGSVADRLSFEERQREEIAARTGGLRGQIVLLALIVPLLSLYLVLTLPGLGDTLISPIGRFVLVPFATVFEVGGILVSRAIVKSVS